MQNVHVYIFLLAICTLNIATYDIIYYVKGLGCPYASIIIIPSSIGRAIKTVIYTLDIDDYDNMYKQKRS